MEVLPHLEAEAKERQRASGVDYGRGGKVEAILPQPLDKPEPKKRDKQSRDKAAELVNVGSRYVQEALEVLPHLEAEAKERQRASGGDKKSDEYQKSVEARLPQPIDKTEPKKKSRDKAAELVNVGSGLVSG